MQSITLLAYITSPPIALLSRATSADAADSARIVSFTAQVAAYKHDEPPMLLSATAWGDAAAKAAATPPTSEPAVTGSCRGGSRSKKASPWSSRLKNLTQCLPPWTYPAPIGWR